MKSNLILIVISIFSFSLFAQNVDVPKKVQDEFMKLYPKVTDAKWDKEGKDFEASFKQNEKDMSIIFDEKGNALETEIAIEISNLPIGIEKYVADNFDGYKITGAAKIVKANKEELFEAEITKGMDKKDLIFDSQGKPEKKDANEENENEEDDED